jgi:hypothetical protein
MSKRSDDASTPYERRRHPELPWGYWLREQDDKRIDEDGEAWDSVRHCLWGGRLGMEGVHRAFEEPLELMFTVLTLVRHRLSGLEHDVNDLFEGSWLFARHYLIWLAREGLLTPDQNALTPEGLAVLRMLAATQPVGRPPVPLSVPTLLERCGYDRGETREMREHVLKAQEAFARDLPYRFVREEVADKPGITLVGVELGQRMPLTRVLWSMRFADDYARDRMFVWLAHRVDRWPAWGKLAYSRGARALSDVLLQLRFCDEPIRLW